MEAARDTAPFEQDTEGLQDVEGLQRMVGSAAETGSCGSSALPAAARCCGPHGRWHRSHPWRGHEPPVGECSAQPGARQHQSGFSQCPWDGISWVCSKIAAFGAWKTTLRLSL